MHPSAAPNTREFPTAESLSFYCARPAAGALAQLCTALDAAFDACADAPDPSLHAAFARAVRAALAEAAADPALLTDEQREASTACYRRHLLAADPLGRYAIAALVWMPGQASPVHAHHTWCGYALIDGTLTETRYEWQADSDCAAPVREQSREPGAVSFTRAGRTCIHRLANGSDKAAVSLHIYGVAGEQIGTHVNDIVRIADTVRAVAA
ncbi:cysteine dioxygenase family protein [Paraburkholderia phymatum]|uniref:Cysteine dioxygenase type I n=1 Tax=Paraburkholderia phymatum (strain DSM 17167 / CIP 108236 / LMG 21445 / STM815) TaxID=391038 RepID=B2JKV8_PARP8|nr:cysteine dioxygenase family protein [Paraburkholderia phymatum]ACC70935.1 cysteine dioxygenase type I [Paraburkholderia phymatum STM815]